jgi:uncharacterized protein
MSEHLARELIRELSSHSSCIVAFSGGVDSAVVAAAAYRALGDRAVAWTGIGPAVSQSDREAAAMVSQSIGIRHVQVETSEIQNPDYVRNGPDRCFHCKSTLYASIRRWADEQGFEAIVSGTNLDDLGDYRPGLKAASDYGVTAPLAKLGIGKDQVREIARLWELSVSEKPASPCLASRIAYGEIVTIGRLAGIEAIERWLAERGFTDVRARDHGSGLLRLEIPPPEWDRFLQQETRAACTAFAMEQGYKFVTLDLGGRASGSLNRVLPATALKT